MILIYTEHYAVKTMTRNLVSDDWRRAAADAALMRTINSAPMMLTLSDLRSYVASFDNRYNHLLGIFDKSSSRHHGIYEVEIHPFHMTANIQSFVWSPPAAKAAEEADPAVLDFLFARTGVEKAIVKIPAYEKREALRFERLGFDREGYLVEERCAPGSTDRVDYIQYGLLKERWS